MEKAACVLTIRKQRLMVHLGCTVEEQKHTQPVDVDVSLKFSKLPQGAESDELSDTICYSKLSTTLKQTVEKHLFRLVEKLAVDLFAAVKKEIPGETGVWIKVTKVNPPVSDLLGGVSFSFGDWTPSGDP